MRASTRGLATSRVTIRTSPRNSLTFLREREYRRHQRGQRPEGYRPTRFQRRYSSDELRAVLHVLVGGKN
jgi:hypothetical protein